MELETKTRVICIGDGITEGFGISSNFLIDYPALLQKFLGEEYIVFNEGVSQSCVTMMETDKGTCGLPYILQPEYDEALSLVGDIYVVMLGTNDARDGMDDIPDTQNSLNNLISYKALFESCYQHIIDGIRSAAPNALIYLATPIPIRPGKHRCYQEKYLLQLIPHMKAVAAKSQIQFIDLHEELLKLSEDELNHLYQEDGIHPNDSGAFLIASMLAYVIGNRAY